MIYTMCHFAHYKSSIKCPGTEIGCMSWQLATNSCAMVNLSNRLTNILTKPVRLWQFILLPEEFTTGRPDVTLTQFQCIVSFNLPNSQAESYGDWVSPCFRTFWTRNTQRQMFSYTHLIIGFGKHTFISQTRFMGIQNAMAELYNACFLTYS
jgi:hypothetical protein